MAKKTYTADEMDTLQRWAVEQIMRLHGNSGLTVDRLTAEADLLVAYITGPKPEEAAKTDGQS